MPLKFVDTLFKKLITDEFINIISDNCGKNYKMKIEIDNKYYFRCSKQICVC
jgi:hypothetical protein